MRSLHGQDLAPVVRSESLVVEAFAQPQVVRVRVRGRSMLPTLREGDEIDVVLGAPVRVGDVVMFLDGTTGNAIVHRVLAVETSSVLTQCDGAARPDAPVDSVRILGVASVPRRAFLARRRAVAERFREAVRRLLGRRALAWLRARA